MIKLNKYAIVLVGQLFFWGFSGNVSAQNATVNKQPINDLLDKYADNLVVSYKSYLVSREESRQTLNLPLTYLIEFKVADASFLTKKSVDSYDSNLEITKRWQNIFCSEEMMSIVKENNISAVHGKIRDLDGTDHSLATCFIAKETTINKPPKKANPVAENLAAQYDMALEHGADTVELCGLAAVVADVYRQSLDEDNYKYWLALKDINCR